MARKGAKKSTSRKKTRARKAEHHEARTQELSGIVLLGVLAFSLLALISIQFFGASFMGPMGRLWAKALYALFGVGTYLLIAAVSIIAVRLLAGKQLMRGPADAVGGLLGLFAVSVLAHLVAPTYRVAQMGPGGKVGEAVADALSAGVGVVGTALLAVLGLLLAATATTPFKISYVGMVLHRGAVHTWRVLRFCVVETGRFVGEVVSAIFPERDEHDEDYDEPAEEVSAVVEEEIGPDEATIRMGEPMADPIIVDHRQGTLPPKAKAKKSRKRLARGTQSDTVIMDAMPGMPDPVDDEASDGAQANNKPEPEIVVSEFLKRRADAAKAKKAPKRKKQQDYIALGDGVYELPSLDLLDYDDTHVNVDREAVKEMAARLVNTLATYNVKGEVQAIRPGPVVTMYEFVPAKGIRLNRIVNLADDLAMSLAALSVRIIAPIPGKNAVGIEVPNPSRETVFLKEMLADDVFHKSKSKLTLALGKDAEGCPVAVNLAKMPHLLVAGTTGSGKSVSVNAMIASLLYKSTPEEVRMIMVDPKMLELNIYEGIPHLLLPVVTDPKKANLALRWSVEEMERRYQLMAEAGVKDILSYNKKVAKLIAKFEADQAAAKVESLEQGEDKAEDDQEAEAEAEAGAEDAPKKPERLPYIVVVIDEFADLMMCAPKEVEHSVTRLAQKARACGIHLILATQRPTTEVITGLIKSNFPSRMAFKVTNKTNSIAILEQSGAEALLGRGDMLFADQGQAVRRVHGCLVQDEEIERVVEFIKKQARPVYDMDILKPRDEEGDGSGSGGKSDDCDEKYDQAVSIVAETRQGSASYLQRRLGIGYNRAARIIEQMEKDGIVGPQQGSKPREVFIQAHG